MNLNDFIVGVNNAGRVVSHRIPSATENEVRAFEEKISAKLPEDYREFLKTVNGGSINPQIERYVCFDVEGAYAGSSVTSDSSQFLNFLFTLSEDALTEAGIDNILTLDMAYRYFVDLNVDYPHRPNDFVPIGNTPGSNLIVIGVRGAHVGKIATYEYMEVDASEPLGNVFHVANDFQGFLNSLYSCE